MDAIFTADGTEVITVSTDESFKKYNCASGA